LNIPFQEVLQKGGIEKLERKKTLSSQMSMHMAQKTVVHCTWLLVSHSVIDKISEVAYKLELPKGSTVDPAFQVSRCFAKRWVQVRQYLPLFLQILMF
jgi:hypothetical protein